MLGLLDEGADEPRPRRQIAEAKERLGVEIGTGGSARPQRR